MEVKVIDGFMSLESTPVANPMGVVRHTIYSVFRINIYLTTVNIVRSVSWKTDESSLIENFD